MCYRAFLLCLIMSGTALADPCNETCMRLGFDDSAEDGFYEYVVSRETYIEMVWISRESEGGSSISESEAAEIALRSVSSSQAEVRRIHYGKTVKSPGDVWIYMVDIESRNYDGIVVVGPGGETVARTFVEGGLTAHPDCFNYRFNVDAGKAGAG